MSPAAHVSRFCPACRRDEVISQVAAVDGSFPWEVIAAAVDAQAA